jgi:predicted metal-binding protein
LGATHAAAIQASRICSEEKLADLCLSCENYGLSMSCPPHVAGPQEFRSLLSGYDHAIVFKIDVPTDILLSEQRQELFRMLHEVASQLEEAAVRMGATTAKAFAGGSCKRIFCSNHTACRVLSQGGECRRPRHARPSMSGYGINVSKLMEAAGWQLEKITARTDPGKIPTGSLCAMVLIPDVS